LWERDRAATARGGTPYFAAARAYVRHGVLADDIEQLIARGEEATAGDLKNVEWDAWSLRAESRLLRGATKEGDGAVTKLGELLRHAQAQPADAAQRRVLRARSAEYFALKALLAEKTDRRADAVAFLRRALADDPDSEELQSRYEAAWRALGGTPEGLVALRDVAASGGAKEATPWEPLEEPLAPFDLTDLSGRRWSSRSLAGKVLLVNLWATWCGPCKMELPFVQRLHEALRNRSDVLVLTLNADAKTSYVQPYVTEQRFTFPVLPALDYVRDVTQGEILLPQTWVVDRAGTVRLRSSGFRTADPEAWVRETIAVLDSLAK
jgi:thiol-disulfide isomerase/thioredoxin